VTKYNFSAQADRFLKARMALMAPHRDGEEESFIVARTECRYAFNNFKVAWVDNKDARVWLETIQRFIDNTDVQGPHEDLVQCIRAMDIEEKSEFSKAVEELASWFRGKSSDTES